MLHIKTLKIVCFFHLDSKKTEGNLWASNVIMVLEFGILISFTGLTTLITLPGVCQISTSLVQCRSTLYDIIYAP